MPAIENSLHKTSIRGKLKKAEKNNLKITNGKSLDDARILYKQYLQMRKEYGLLSQPYQFFTTILEQIPAQNFNILHAEYQGRKIASILLLTYKNTVTYEYGATLSEMKKYGASPYLLWQAIRQAKHDGFQKFDFGRTADDNTGLVRFKERWGTKREPLLYYYFPDFGSGAQIRKNGFSKRLMAYSMHHLPEPVCQFAGKMLYRSFV
ncbi:MAG: GNAT family N-acetyltransferase [bacterium]